MSKKRRDRIRGHTYPSGTCTKVHIHSLTSKINSKISNTIDPDWFLPSKAFISYITETNRENRRYLGRESHLPCANNKKRIDIQVNIAASFLSYTFRDRTGIDSKIVNLLHQRLEKICLFFVMIDLASIPYTQGAQLR